MSKRNLFLWSLYDFANSIVYISFVLYFSQWLVIDAGLSDFWYNALFAIATVLLLFSAPAFAAYVDKHGGGKLFLNYATIGTAVSYGAAALFAIYNIGLLPAAVAFVLGQYFYQLSFVFYTPMLVELAPVGQRARASGVGQFANALGQITGVLLTLPFAYSHTASLLPSIGVFFVLSLPMMLWFKESRTAAHEPFVDVFRGELQLFFKKLFVFITTSAATSFLVAYFFFNDALITLINNYAILLQRVFEVSDQTKSLLLLAILVMSAIGGVVAGVVADRIGTFKTLTGLVVAWVVVLPIIATINSFTVFAIFTAGVGLLVGSSYSISRVYLTELLNPREMTYGFSLFSLFERFASLIGPLSWGTTVVVFGGGIFSYRMAILAMAGLMGIGLLILLVFRKSRTMRAVAD